MVVTLSKKNFKIKSVEKDDAVSNEVFLTALAKILAKDFMRQREKEREAQNDNRRESFNGKHLELPKRRKKRSL